MDPASATPHRNASTAALSRLAARPPAQLIGAALLAFLGLALIPLNGDSCTYDEGTHLAAGYVAASLRDYRMSIDNPPLTRMFAALPLLLQKIELPTEDALWERPPLRYAYAFKLLYHVGNDPDRLLFWTRLMNLFWGLLLIPSVYAVGRRLHGPEGGLISLVAAAFCPTLLAHAHLMTPDVGVTALYFLTTVAFWLLLERPTYRRSAAFGILLGGALLSKHNGLLLLPTILAVGVAFRVKHRDRPPGQRPLAACLIVAVALTWLVIWAAYGFRFSGSPDPAFAYDWASLRHNKGALGAAVEFARAHRLLPEGHLFGLSVVVDTTTDWRDAYALGRPSTEGWWWYFPFALLVKTPFGTLALLGWALWTSLRKPPRESMEDALLFLPVVLFMTFLMTRNMNIGLRHALPVLPFLWVALGRIDLDASAPVARRRLAIALLGGTAASTLWAAPHFIGYFNEPASLFERRRLLIDSNLDWGQDLGRLKRYLDERKISRVKLAYFGAASPRHLGLNHEYLPSFNVYLDVESEWKKAVLAPGDLVAISATTLSGGYLDAPDFYETIARKLEPVGRVGQSIHLFKVPAQLPFPEGELKASPRTR